MDIKHGDILYCCKTSNIECKSRKHYFNKGDRFVIDTIENDICYISLLHMNKIDNGLRNRVDMYYQDSIITNVFHIGNYFELFEDRCNRIRECAKKFI